MFFLEINKCYNIFDEMLSLNNEKSIVEWKRIQLRSALCTFYKFQAVIIFDQQMK
jgi:hypothetical protein